MSTGGGRRAVADLAGDRTETLLTVVTAALALALVAPLAWLFVEVGGLGARAWELTVAETTVAVLLRSVGLVAVVTGAAVAVGVPLAVLTVQADLPFARFWTVACAVPLAIPSYLGAFAAVSAFGPRGELSTVLPAWIEVPTIYGFWGAAAVLTLYTYPYVFLTTRAALLSLDASLVEAARTLDATRLAAFRRITLPQIAPGIAAGALLVALYTLADFGTPAMMQVEVFTQFIYARYNGFMRGYAALLSLQLLVVTAGILAVESAIGADDSGAYGGRGNRGALGIALGPWRWPAQLAPAAIAALAIALPVGIYGFWLFRGGPGYEAGRLAFSWTYGWHSVSLSLAAAVCATLVAVPIALRSVAADSLLARLAERAPYVGYATPGVVLGIALASGTLNLVPALFRTVPLLVFAYVVRFVPQAIGAVRTATLQVDRGLVEASRTLGRSRLGTFRAVTLPLIAPGIATGAALVFLTTMKELPATLLLRPFGYDTLVTYIWRVEELGQYGQAAVPALVLVVVSGLSMAAILAREGG